MQLGRRKTALALLLVLLAPFIVACGQDGSTQTPTSTAPVQAPATVAAQSTPLPNTSSPIATAVSNTPEVDASPAADAFKPVNLTKSELLEYKPNELGTIPIFMYHNIVTDPTLEGHLYRTVDEFWGDLQWMYDNNFYLVGMNSVVRGNFEVPAGKHPVVLTFDDSSSMHFSFELGPDGQPLLDENGDYIITPNSAVGIIEKFAAEHPDFGKTAHFSTIPVFKFSWPEYEQDEWYEVKVKWLVDNGYEIGNHTSDHVDLTGVDAENFARNIAEPYILISQIVDPSNPNFAMSVLTLPYGAYEEGGWSGEKYQYLSTGFRWDGVDIQVEGVLLVCCGAQPGPFNVDYNRLWIARIRGEGEDIDRLDNEIKQGWTILYTSDGNPDTVTVPWPLPRDQWGKLNEEAVTSRGLTLVKYNPDNGKIFAAEAPRERQAYNHRERARVTA